MFNQVVAGTAAPPCRLSSDHDRLFEFYLWKANLRILEVTEVKTVPYASLSHPFIEKLVSTVRREYLDLVPFRNARDLQRKLHEFQAHYNRDRVHRSLDGLTPDTSAGTGNSSIAFLDDYRWESYCRGLYQLPAMCLDGTSPPTD